MIFNVINRIYTIQNEIDLATNNDINVLYRKILDALYKIKKHQPPGEDNNNDINSKIELWHTFYKNEKKKNHKICPKCPISIIFSRSFDVVIPTDLAKKLKNSRFIHVRFNPKIQLVDENDEDKKSTYLFCIGICNLEKKYFLLPKMKLNDMEFGCRNYLVSSKLNIRLFILE